MQKTYHVKAVWDPDAEVFYAETDIPGLHVEAATMTEFFQAVEELAPQMIVANDSPARANRAEQQARPTLKSAAMELCFA
jgi:hypothetical protein